MVVLSDFLAEGWEQPLRQLGVRHDVVAIAVEDPRESELPDAGWLDLEDAETGATASGGHRGPSGARPAAGAGGAAEGRSGPGVRRRQVDQVVIATNADYAPVLRRAFAQRARRIHR